MIITCVKRYKKPRHAEADILNLLDHHRPEPLNPDGTIKAYSKPSTNKATGKAKGCEHFGRGGSFPTKAGA